ncbi:RNA polymerase sigma factor [Thalassobacillus sp. CUG 92003]|uniref:RNA polymerase sigma factor n=1 Tax=Thalassobacillus sp. CUG 92003 TaxID=2736641 RepID=UPI0015E72569|nr:RNA polymerase sigma factor [Thalassobacillus sp. CUG 92003]
MRPLVQNAPKEANEIFENAVQPYMVDLKHYCCSLTTSSWDGEDLMQEALAKAFKRWSTTFRPVSKSYLFRIAYNAWVDGHRKRKPPEDLHEDVSELPVGKESDSEALVEGMQLLLQELSPKQRIAMLLVDGLDYSVREAANMIGSKEGALKAVLHRARRKIKQGNDQAVSYSDDDNVTTYITAFQTGKPETLIDLFQKEIGAPRMGDHQVQSTFNPQMIIQSIAGSEASYVLVTIQTKQGKSVVMPFYRSERFALFTTLTEEVSFAA